jgi:tRNA-specific adenosine deaminase 2
MNATNRTYNGTRHAEFMAISSILSSRTSSGEKMYSPDVLRECDLYVTVEPCIMCASLLRQIGVRKVYYGASNEKFGGTGGVLSIHRGNGRKTDDGEGKGGDGKRRDDERREERDFEVSGGWLRDEAVVMLQRFYMQENERAPEPRARGKKEAELEGAEDGVVDRRAKMGDG